MGLQVPGPVERAEMRDQLVFVARRQQRRHQDDVGDLLVDRGDGRIARLDQQQVGAHELAHDAREDGALTNVGLDCED